MSAARPVVTDLSRSRAILVKTEPVFPQRRHVLPLPQRRGADHLRAVVRQDGAAGGRGHPRREGRDDQVRSSGSRRSISTGWKTSTTGASPASSGGAIRSRRGTAMSAAISTSAARIRRSAKMRLHASDARRGRARHLVLLGTLAVLHAGWPNLNSEDSEILVSDDRYGHGL